jgi:Uma2 family endonuclease
MTMTLTSPPQALPTLADLLDQLGVAAWRVLAVPAPGTATEKDLIELDGRAGSLYELVDGTLVEKGMGYRESLLAVVLIELIHRFVRQANLGLVTGSDGMVRLFPGLVRIPDVAYVSWSRIPGGRVPSEPIPSLIPELAIEVLSESNTRAEMDRKYREYFSAGVRLVWEVDPERRTVAVYTTPDRSRNLAENQTLDGGEVLPGFALPLVELFSELDQRPTA